MRTEVGVSPVVSTGLVFLSLLLFVLVYGALMVANIYLLAKFARKGVAAEGESPAVAAAS